MCLNVSIFVAVKLQLTASSRNVNYGNLLSSRASCAVLCDVCMNAFLIKLCRCGEHSHAHTIFCLTWWCTRKTRIVSTAAAWLLYAYIMKLSTLHYTILLQGTENEAFEIWSGIDMRMLTGGGGHTSSLVTSATAHTFYVAIWQLRIGSEKQGGIELSAQRT